MVKKLDLELIKGVSELFQKIYEQMLPEAHLKY